MSGGRFNTLTAEERLRRLQTANQIRTWRADLRAAIRDQHHRSLLIAVIRDPQGIADVRGYRRTALDSIKVRKALAWGVSIGPTRAKTMMRQAKIQEEATLAGLTQVERDALISLIQEFTDRLIKQRERAA